jgi:hypothetical protein
VDGIGGLKIGNEPIDVAGGATHPPPLTPPR